MLELTPVPQAELYQRFKLGVSVYFCFGHWMPTSAWLVINTTEHLKRTLSTRIVAQILLIICPNPLAREKKQTNHISRSLEAKRQKQIPARTYTAASGQAPSIQTAEISDSLQAPNRPQSSASHPPTKTRLLATHATKRTSASQIRRRNGNRNPREPHPEQGQRNRKTGGVTKRLLTSGALDGGASVGALRHGPLAARVHGELGGRARRGRRWRRRR